MKILNYIFTLFSIALLTPTLSYSQELLWGPEEEKMGFISRELNADPHTFFDGESYYIIRRGKLSNFSFEKFDHNLNKTIETLVSIKTTLGSKYNDNFNWYVILRENSFLFITRRIEKNKSYVLEFFELTKEGILKNEKLHEIQFDKYWNIAVLPIKKTGVDNVNKIAIWNFGSSLDYKKYNAGKIETNFHIFDENLNPLREGNIQIPYDRGESVLGNFAITDCVIGEDNSIHAVCSVFRPKLEKDESAYEVFSYYPDNKFVSYNPTKASSYLSSAQVKLLPDNKLLIFGTYKQNQVKVFDGFVFGQVNITTQQQPTFTQNDLDNSYLDLYRDPKLKPKFVNSFYIKELTFDDEGNYDLIIQNEFNSLFCNSSGRCVTVLNYGPIYVAKINSSGKLLQLSDIPKFQNNNFGNNFSSFISYRKNGELNILFNDYESNDDATKPSSWRTFSFTQGSRPYIVTIDSKGGISKKPFDLIKEDLFLKPISCIKTKNGYILFAEKKDRMKLARFTLE
jgi:hypothetical protein